MVQSDILSHNDSQQTTTQPIDHDNSLINRLGREGEVVGLGIGEGLIDGVANISSHWKQAVESAGIGYAMGAAMRFGTPGKVLALGAGAFMLGDMVYNEVTGGRWQKIGGAMSDAWNSSANLQQDIQTSRQQLGSFAFDTALAVGTGGLGAKIGFGNFAADGVGTSLMEKTMGTNPTAVGASVESAISGLNGKLSSLTGQTESAAYGLSLSANVAKTLTPFEAAQEFLAPKRFTGLDQIKEAYTNGLVEKDGTYVGLKGQLQETLDQHQSIQTRSTQLTQELGQHVKDLKQWNELTPQKQAVQTAEDNVAALKTQKETVLPQQQAELRSVNEQLANEARAREAAKKQAESDPRAAKVAASKKGQTGDTAVQAGTDLKSRRSDLSASVKDLTSQTSDEAFRSARVKVADAQETLRQAQEQAPGKITELEQMIQSKQAELAAHQQSIGALADNTVQLLDKLKARRAEVSGDLTKAVPVDDSTVARKAAPVRTSADSAATVSRADTSARTTDRVTKPATVQETVAPEVALRSTADSALSTAQESVKPFAADRELRFAKHQKESIASGKVRVPDKDQAMEDAEVKVAKAESQAKAAGPTKYAQTVRSLRDYANAAGEYLAKEQDPSAREAYAKQAVVNLESLMPSVDNLYRGVKGSSDLSRLNVNRPFDAYSRLSDIQNHLQSRIDQIDANNLRRNSRVIGDNPVFGQLQQQLKDLPSDGAIFFFNKDGQLLKGPMTYEGKIVGQDGMRYRTDALNLDGTINGADGKPVTGTSGDPIHARTTFKAIDVRRWQQHGIDSNGAGIDRFKNDDVSGAVIVQPKLDASGKPIELRRFSKGAQGKPTIAKEVVGTVGTVPEDVQTGMSLGNLMKRFDPDQAVRQQAATATTPQEDPTKR